MYQYVFNRLFILIFFILIILAVSSTVLIVGFEFDHFFQIVLIKIIYYIPHSFLASFLIFISLFLFKKGNPPLNKVITNKITLKPFRFGLFIFIIGFFVLSINFYIQEYVTNDISTKIQTNDINPVNHSNNVNNKNKEILDKLSSIIDYIKLGDYLGAINEINKGKSLKQYDFLFGFLFKISNDFYTTEEEIKEKAQKVIEDFQDGYILLQNRKYEKSIEFFQKTQHPEKKYFIDKAQKALNYQKIENKNEIRLNLLITLGKIGVTYNSVTVGELKQYLSILNDIYPAESILENELEQHQISLKNTKIIEELMKKESDSPYNRNLYYYFNSELKENGLKFVSKIKNDDDTIFNLGKTIMLVGDSFPYNGKTILKDIVILNTDYNDDKPPVYTIMLAEWVEKNGNYIKVIKNWKTLKPNNGYVNYNQQRQDHFIPDRASGRLILPENSNITINNLIFLNKICKLAPNISIFDMYNFTSTYNKQVPPLFNYFITDKISYYLTNISLFILFLLCGFIAKTKYEKVPLWHTKILLSLFLVGLTLFCHYCVKQIFQLFLT